MFHLFPYYKEHFQKQIQTAHIPTRVKASTFLRSCQAYSQYSFEEIIPEVCDGSPSPSLVTSFSYLIFHAMKEVTKEQKKRKTASYWYHVHITTSNRGFKLRLSRPISPAINQTTTECKEKRRDRPFHTHTHTHRKGCRNVEPDFTPQGPEAWESVSRSWVRRQADL